MQLPMRVYSSTSQGTQGSHAISPCAEVTCPVQHSHLCLGTKQHSSLTYPRKKRKGFTARRNRPWLQSEHRLREAARERKTKWVLEKRALPVLHGTALASDALTGPNTKQAVLRKPQHTQYRFAEHPKEIFKDKYSTLIFTHCSFPRLLKAGQQKVSPEVKNWDSKGQVCRASRSLSTPRESGQNRIQAILSLAQPQETFFETVSEYLQGKLEMPRITSILRWWK